MQFRHSFIVMKLILLLASILVFTCMVSAGKSDQGTRMCKIQNSSLIKDSDMYDVLMGPISEMVEERTCNCVDNAIKAVRKELQKLQWRKKIMKSCLDWYRSGKQKDGVYKIYPDDKTPSKAYCDMRNGGWTVIQKRVSGKTTFDRVWLEYVKGFGDVNADHWLGLKNINLLTKHPNAVSFTLWMKGSGKVATAVYNGFQVEDEETHFRLHVSDVGTYNLEMMNYVNKEQGFYFQNGMMFTTKDADHDKYGKNCAHEYNIGGWWYKNCYRIGSLNAAFNNMHIYTDKGFQVSKSVVKIRESASISDC